MGSYILRPLKWRVNGPAVAEVTTPINEYTTRYSPEAKCYVTHYFSFTTDETGYKYTRTLGEAIHWVENTHLPAKLLVWFTQGAV